MYEEELMAGRYTIFREHNKEADAWAEKGGKGPT